MADSGMVVVMYLVFMAGVFMFMSVLVSMEM